MDGGAEPLTSAGRECDVTSFLFFPPSLAPALVQTQRQRSPVKRLFSLPDRLHHTAASPALTFRLRQQSFLQPLVKMTEHVWFCYCGFTCNVSWCGVVTSQGNQDQRFHVVFSRSAPELVPGPAGILRGEQRRCCNLVHKERPCRYQTVNWWTGCCYIILCMILMNSRCCIRLHCRR